MKAKLIETWIDDYNAPGGNRRIFIVLKGSDKFVFTKKLEAKAKKAELDIESSRGRSERLL